MRKYMIYATSLCIFSMALLVHNLPKHEPITGTYNMTGEITSPSTIATEDGNLWGFSSNLPTETEVVVLLDDNGTPNNVHDDVIISVNLQ